jgi:hypothetical protein
MPAAVRCWLSFSIEERVLEFMVILVCRRRGAFIINARARDSLKTIWMPKAAKNIIHARWIARVAKHICGSMTLCAWPQSFTRWVLLVIAWMSSCVLRVLIWFLSGRDVSEKTQRQVVRFSFIVFGACCCAFCKFTVFLAFPFQLAREPQRRAGGCVRGGELQRLPKADSAVLATCADNNFTWTFNVIIASMRWSG